MRAAVVACALALALTPARAGDVEDAAFVEVSVERDTFFVSEPIRVTLRVGIDEEAFAKHVVQPFQRALDVPVQVDVAWFDELEGTTVLRSAEETGRTAVLNDELARFRVVGEETRAGRRFTLLAIERRLLPESPGELMLSAPRLQFTYATEFEEDFVGGPVAIDPKRTTTEGGPLALTVSALPEEGRPDGFAGVLGNYAVSATTQAIAVDPGETFQVVLRIEGEGNLEVLETPRLPAMEGFHVLGALDDRGKAVRTITYDVAATVGGLDAFPAIPFAFFDGTPPGAYRVVHTDPLPLDVRGAAPAPNDPAPVEPQDDASQWPVGGLLILVIVGVTVVVLGKKRRPVPDMDAAQADAAMSALRDALSAPDADPADALAAFVGARLDCPPAAVITPDLPKRLAAAGVAPETAADVAGLLEELVSARYGAGPLEADAAARVMAVAERMAG